MLPRTPLLAGCLLAVGLVLCVPARAISPANPAILGFGGAIQATPHFPITGETTQIAVKVFNTGGNPATNVQVRLSFNDWGVTFQGWQEIETKSVTVPPLSQVTVSFDHVFQSRAHTCLEALIVGADENGAENDDRGQINLEVINAGEAFPYPVPVVNEGPDVLQLLLEGHAIIGDGRGFVLFQKPVEVEPGKELVAPVEILPPHPDFEGPALVEVNAYALDPVTGLPDRDDTLRRNHVRIAVRFTSAQTLIGEALAGVGGLLDAPQENPAGNQLAAAAKHLQQALDRRAWTHRNRASKKGGAAVFAQIAAAIRQLLVADPQLSATDRQELDQALRALTDAARILAVAAMRDAGGGAQAQAALTDGDRRRQAGEYPEAVHAYSQASARAGS